MGRIRSVRKNCQMIGYILNEREIRVVEVKSSEEMKTMLTDGEGGEQQVVAV